MYLLTNEGVPQQSPLDIYAKPIESIIASMLWTNFRKFIIRPLYRNKSILSLKTNL